MEANGIRMVLAPSFARIFRQNMFNCGLLAIELPEETVNDLFGRFGKDRTSVEADLSRNVLSFRSAEDEVELPFSLSPFDRDLVVAGGWVAYANAKY
jgi:3-isopropylmalate/(R)-2-methylmalate dehydratase small subunit